MNNISTNPSNKINSLRQKHQDKVDNFNKLSNVKKQFFKATKAASHFTGIKAFGLGSTVRNFAKAEEEITIPSDGM